MSSALNESTRRLQGGPGGAAEGRGAQRFCAGRLRHSLRLQPALGTLLARTVARTLSACSACCSAAWACISGSPPEGRLSYGGRRWVSRGRWQTLRHWMPCRPRRFWLPRRRATRWHANLAARPALYHRSHFRERRRHAGSCLDSTLNDGAASQTRAATLAHAPGPLTVRAPDTRGRRRRAAGCGGPGGGGGRDDCAGKCRKSRHGRAAEPGFHARLRQVR